ncbi:MAG: hypothetical protein IH621_05780 [Krumholzibacteria bacterium]|nr:hypothetical protein [Candidatus Krumholzibacteria bacterium]
MDLRKRNLRMDLSFGPRRQRRLAPLPLLLVLSAALPGLIGGCADDDCVNCVGLPLPVVPTGVHSISGDNEVIVQWYDISYAPYDGTYSENVAGYRVYSRFFAEGDQNDPDRDFYLIGEVAWNENYDPTSGLHWFVDADADNGERYEYAVAAVNAAGGESALSFEFVTDAPLPMGSVELFDGNGPFANLSGFDFSGLEQGRTDPFGQGSKADVYVAWQGGVPYLHAANEDIYVQDFGVFSDGLGGLIFEGVSWAPVDGWSATGVLEIVVGHIYVLEIYDPVAQTLHYAKLGITAVGTGAVQARWAYQLIEGLPELSAPEGGKPVDVEPVTLRL